VWCDVPIKITKPVLESLTKPKCRFRKKKAFMNLTLVICISLFLGGTISEGYWESGVFHYTVKDPETTAMRNIWIKCEVWHREDKAIMIVPINNLIFCHGDELDSVV
jgi:hypothetical protein